MPVGIIVGIIELAQLNQQLYRSSAEITNNHTLSHVPVGKVTIPVHVVLTYFYI